MIANKTFLILIFCFPMFLIGQDLDELKVSVLTGPSICWFSTNDNKIFPDGAKLGYKAHVEGEYMFNSKFSITLGMGLSLGQGGTLRYAQGGHLWSDSELNIPNPDSLPNNVSLSYNINYLDFPIGFKLRTQDFGKFRFYFHAPEFQISLRTKARGKIEGIGVSSEDERINEQINFINISYSLGAGTEYQYSEGLTLIGGLRFVQNITDITDDSGIYFDGSRENSKGILSAVDLRIGVLF
ncbi:MAG: PorT family protein [Bacteroidota bacterium]|nr:PorT family protein [Bacteroidota bacterium]